MRVIHSLVIMSVVFGSLSSAASTAAGVDMIPNDFKLAAEFYPPYAPRYAEDYPVPWKIWYPWAVTISANGEALQETDLSVGDQNRVTKKSFKLTENELKQLVRAIQESGFYLLASEYSYKVTDNPTLVLRVNMNRKSHAVMVYAPDHLKQREDVAAFLKVWNEVLKYVPPPNPGQGPE